MKTLKFFLKLFSIAILIFLYLLSSFTIFLFVPARKRRKALCFNCSYFVRKAIKILGLKILVIKEFLPAENEPYFIVSNHVSYTDILVISSFFPSSFVTSTEVEKDIFLGTLAKAGGSLFVERRKKTRLLKDLKQVTDVLLQNINVVVFPEGTSTNGEKIFPFKKTLFRAAINAKIPVLPLHIRYTSIDGQLINEKNRDKIFWYGDMKFFPHFLSFLKLDSIHVNLKILQEIPCEFQSSDQIAKIAYQVISDAHQKI